MKPKVKNFLYVLLILAPLIVILTPFTLQNHKQSAQPTQQLSYASHHTSKLVAFEPMNQIA